MPTTTFSQEEIQLLAAEIRKQLIPALLQEFQEKQLPPFLLRKDLMKLTGIGEAKVNELFNRQDFPVNRELGYPRVPTKLFFDWMYATTQNANLVNMKYPYKVI